MKIVTIKQNYTKLVFHEVPKIDCVPLLPADVIGCSVFFLLKINDGSIPAIRQAAVINGDATFSYPPVATDVQTPGTFQQEWELVYGTGKRLTFPNNTYNLVQILADLG